MHRHHRQESPRLRRLLDDFVPDATGDLFLAVGDDEVGQRLERRLFTGVGG